MAEWIKASKRLPDHENRVLGITETKTGRRNAVLAYYSHELGRWVAGMNDNVIYWMEIPEITEE